MAYDPKDPASIFIGDNCYQFLQGLTNASAIRLGTGGDPFRPDLGVCMQALDEAEAIRHMALERMD